jgi:cyclopropane-fatty-acyl-phospholipid synthase
VKVGLALRVERIFGLDYAVTLATWRERFREAWPNLVPLGFDERFRRMWEYYLAYCEAGFLSGNIDVRQIVYTKPA